MTSNQPQTSEWHAAAFKISEQESSSNSNFEQFKWLEEDRINYEDPYLYAKSSPKPESYSSEMDQPYLQLVADYQIKMDVRSSNSNQDA